MTVREIKAWLKATRTAAGTETPNHLELPGLLYRLGARPLNPDPKNRQRPGSVSGKRLWRLARTWRDRGTEYNLETMSLTRLAKLHESGAVPFADLKAVDEAEP